MNRPASIWDSFNALSFTGWLIAVVLLAAAMVRPMESLGIVVLPFAALTLLLGLLFPAERIVADSSRWPLELHIVIAILAYSLLTLAACRQRCWPSRIIACAIAIRAVSCAAFRL